MKRNNKQRITDVIYGSLCIALIIHEHITSKKLHRQLLYKLAALQLDSLKIVIQVFVMICIAIFIIIRTAKDSWDNEKNLYDTHDTAKLFRIMLYCIFILLMILFLRKPIITAAATLLLGIWIKYIIKNT